MTDPSTRILEILQSVESASGEELLPLVYDELRALARARMAREQPGRTLQATALVHEAFLRLGAQDDAKWEGRRHFFGAAAEAMRRILVDQARRRSQLKHGAAYERSSLEDEQVAADPEFLIEDGDLDAIAIDDALQQLEAEDPRAREIVNLRCFVGLTIPETAEAMGISPSTVEREWRFLRTFLQHALGEEEA